MFVDVLEMPNISVEVETHLQSRGSAHFFTRFVFVRDDS